MAKSKRKRSNSSERRGGNDKKASISSVNPFLPDDEESEAKRELWRKRSSILDHAIAFDELSKDKYLSEECLSHIIALLVFLKEKTTVVELASLTVDAALLLLPWAIRCILTKQDQASPVVCWEGLYVCLECLSTADEPRIQQNISQSSLSQSNLHKLVPRVTKVALSMEQDFGVAKAVNQNPGKSNEKVGSLAALSLPLLLAKYRPSVEIACQTLMTLIVQEATTCDSVALTVVQWIASMLQTANPKTVFQLFATRLTLLILSKLYFGKRLQTGPPDVWYDLYEANQESPLQGAMDALVAAGLFDPKHHMEGLCSLLSSIKSRPKEGKMENSFQCYQQNLLSTLHGVAKLEDELDVEFIDTRYLLALFPVLLKEFFRASKAWEHTISSKTHKKKASTAERTNRVQFEMFRQIVFALDPLLDERYSSTTKSVVDCIRGCLDLVLQFDVYLPSQDDKEASQFQVLERLGRQFLSISDGLRSQQNALAPALVGLRTLLLLDHRIFDERLVDLLSFCLCCTDEQQAPNVINLLAAAVDVHRQLRQQDHFFDALVALVDSVANEEKFEMKCLLLYKWLKHDLLARSFADAIETCPFNQVEHVFIILRRRIERLLQTSSEGYSILSVLVAIAVLLMRNIRVERDNAAGVKILCFEFAASISTSLADSSGNQPTRKATLALFAWILELNTRAAFWTGHSYAIELPASLIASAWTYDETDNVYDELLLLLGHRLRELHGLIYESERIDFRENSSLRSSDTKQLAQQAITTSAHVAEIANRHIRNGADLSRWAWVAEHCLPYWLPYASKAHVDCMLRWLFRTISCGSSQCASSLISDASFYENAVVMSHFADAAMSVNDYWLQTAGTGKGDQNGGFSESHETSELVLRQAAVSVNIINGVFHADKGYAAIPCHRETLNAALQLDERAQTFVDGVNENAANQAATALCGSLRHLVSNLATTLTEANARLLLQSRPPEKEILRLVRSLPSICATPLIEGSGSLVGQLIRLMVTSGQSGMSVEVVIRNIFDKVLDPLALVAVSRHILRELSNHCFEDQVIPQLLFDGMWSTVVKLVLPQMGTPASVPESDSLAVDPCFLFGDLLLFAREHSLSERWPRPEIRVFLESKCFSSLVEGPTASAPYMIACLAATSPPAEMRRRILEHIAMSRNWNPLMNAAFSDLVHQTDDAGIRSLLGILLSIAENPERDATNQMRLIGSCLHCEDGTTCAAVLKELAGRLLSATLSQLNQRSARPDHILASCAVLEDLLASRRIVTFRDIDLTRLLFHLSAVVGHNGPREDISALPTGVYTACTKVYATAFHRYTKYLYACAPLVILLVKAFLARILCEQDLADAVIIDRAQRFARVCELFVEHKEIYKKHVVGLILEYVHALENNLSLVRKTSLIPSIHHLLDVLSIHELKQLDAMMGPSATVLFKGIYHNHQKVHAYKGR